MDENVPKKLNREDAYTAGICPEHTHIKAQAGCLFSAAPVCTKSTAF